MRSLVRCLTLVCLVVCVLLLSLQSWLDEAVISHKTLQHFQIGFITIENYSTDLASPRNIKRSESTTADRTPRHHVFFLKTHKCGSSTVQNVLMRHGLQRGLNFALPLFGNYLGSPDRFEPARHLDSSSEQQFFHMFVHHSRYHASNVARIMPPDTVRVTILRDPAFQFESMASYYDLRFRNLTLAQLLDAPLVELRKVVSAEPRLVGRIGRNQMCFDLGLDVSDFDNPTSVRQLMTRTRREFHLVMLSEHMEASLVLLADLLCWPLENMTFVTLNSRPDAARTSLTSEHQKKLRELNRADWMLYKHFRRLFRRKVTSYGVTRMRRDVTRLVSLNQRIRRECVTSGAQLQVNAPSYCRYYTLSENNFTSVLRAAQRERTKVLDKLKRIY